MVARSALNVSLTPEFTDFVAKCVASGRYRSASEVVREALRRFEEDERGLPGDPNKAFLLRFADLISQTEDPNRIMAEAAFLLGSHLEADRAGYACVSDDGKHVNVRHDWVAGDMPSLNGWHLLDNFGAQRPAKLRKGETVRCADVTLDKTLHEQNGSAARLATLALRAAISVPLVKDGRLRAILFVHQRTPRDWTDEDERLVREVAGRTWAAVQRAEAERALAISEARFRAIFETTRQFMGLMTPEGLMLKVNPAVVEFEGLPADQIVGRKLWDVRAWAEAPNPAVPARLRAAVASAASGTPVQFEAELRAAHGIATVDFGLRPVRDADGNVVFLVPEGRDITARKAIQRQVEKSEARFRALADAMPQMIFAADPAGNNIYCNARLLAFAGIPQGLNRTGWAELVHPEDRQASVELRRKTLITGEDFEREHRLRRYDGTYRWVLVRAVAVRNAAGEIESWFGTCTDITDIVDARHVLKQSNEELERVVAERTRALQDAAHELANEMRRREDLQSNVLQAQKLEAIGQLTSGVVHDFNNILAAISGSYTLIRKRADNDKLLRIVDLGEKSVERARRLIEQLMNFIRREKLAPKVLDLADLLPETEDLICHAVGPDVQCRFAIAPEIWPVLSDPFQLEVALLNLVVNARDAMDWRGEITVSARNLEPGERPVFLSEGEYVSIAVTDTGRGMPPEVMARAAEEFFTTKPKGEGTGLGLPMVHGFAARMGGTVRIDSSPGQGTTVEIILPRAPIDGAMPHEPADATPDPSLHGDATILLVDDDEHVREIASTFLRDLGYTVLSCGSTETATALVQTLRRLDLLVTDVFMAGASGPVLALRLRTDWPGLPVLFITGATPGSALAGEAVLRKPFNLASLSTAVLERLGRWTPPGTGDKLLTRLRTNALRQFYLNWQSAKIEGVMLPRLSGLDPARFGLGPHAFTVAVESTDPVSLRYISVGSALARRLGRRLDDAPVEGAERDADVVGQLAAAYRRSTRNGAPIYQTARFDFGDGAALLLERLILPVSEDGEAITHLVGIVIFNETASPALPKPASTRENVLDEQ